MLKLYDRSEMQWIAYARGAANGIKLKFIHIVIYLFRPRMAAALICAEVIHYINN